MKIALCILSYKRHDLTAKTLAHNLSNAGYGNTGLFVEDTKGIAKASNNLIRRAYLAGYEAFVIMGNDILMPDNWLKEMQEAIEPRSGMIAYPDHVKPQRSYEMVIGNFLITRQVVDKVGAFDERFDPYGAIDLDYNKRCTDAGFHNYYLPGGKFTHIHEHNGQELYGYDKATMVARTWHLHENVTLGHIPLIEQTQFENEKHSHY